MQTYHGASVVRFVVFVTRLRNISHMSEDVALSREDVQVDPEPMMRAHEQDVSIIVPYNLPRKSVSGDHHKGDWAGPSGQLLSAKAGPEPSHGMSHTPLYQSWDEYFEYYSRSWTAATDVLPSGHLAPFRALTKQAANIRLRGLCRPSARSRAIHSGLQFVGLLVFVRKMPAL